jgi:hypothetical protein
LPDQTTLKFYNQSSGRAKDDDGKMVPKDTWDYYDSSGKRNVAIEIWKEADRDYPEAYDGKVIDTSTIKLFSPAENIIAAAKIKPAKSVHFGSGLVLGIMAFFAFMSGMPFDILLTLSVPGICLYVMFFQYNSLFWVAVFGATWLLFSALILFIWHGVASYWVVMLVLLIISVFVIKTIGSYYPDAKEKITPTIFAAVFLPGTWTYSFYMYFMYAPGPHNFNQLMVTCLLPVFLTGILFLINWALN